MNPGPSAESRGFVQFAKMRSRRHTTRPHARQLLLDGTFFPSSVCEDVDVPLAWAMPPLPPHPPTASPRTGTKRKWDDDTSMTRRRPAPLPPWVANASTHIASPRWPLWSASGGGTVSPSSSPLAHSGSTTRRVPTPVLSSNTYCHGHARAATPPAIAIPRPMSPTLSAWQPLSLIHI